MSTEPAIILVRLRPLAPEESSGVSESDRRAAPRADVAAAPAVEPAQLGCVPSHRRDVP